MQIADLISRAAQYDASLARDLAEYVRGRRFGLVYEASKPEFVRLYNKPVVVGDLANILPPRGVLEDTKNDDDSSDITYRVAAVEAGKATVVNVETGRIVSVDVDDIVPLARFDQPIYAGLRETGRIERGGDKPYHVVINGENYHAIQTLLYAYQGRVTCIYLDPPYNTEATEWKYNNNYVDPNDVYKHSKWLTMMEDRLRLTRKLLNMDKSVLIVTIDEKEYLRLGLLLEQIFPEAKMQMISTVINPKGNRRDNEFSRCEEYIYILLFGDMKVKGINNTMLREVGIHDDAGEEDDSVRWKATLRSASNNGRRSARPNLFYPLLFDQDTGEFLGVGPVLDQDARRDEYVPVAGQVAVWPIGASGEELTWNLQPETFVRNQAAGYVRFGPWDGKTRVPYHLTRGQLSDIKAGNLLIIGHDEDGAVILRKKTSSQSSSVRPFSIWNQRSHSSSEQGSGVLKALVPGSSFPFPKSLYAVEDTLRFFVADEPEAIIVDYFAGSGTTAHATMRLNRQDGGRRICISVTNNEVSRAEAKKLTEAGLRQGDEEWERHGICRDITIPRIRAAISGYTRDGNPIPEKYRYGIMRESYIEDTDDVVISRKKVTGEQRGRKIYYRTRSGYELAQDIVAISKTAVEKGKTIYVKRKVQDPAVPDAFPMADGFEENAIFFDLTYLEPSVVSADLAFNEVAPIMWLFGGCKGEILTHSKNYAIGETYAVLFNYRHVRKFIKEIEGNPSIGTIFIVTDLPERYRDMCAEFPNRRVVQLYESYLRSFEINCEV